MDQSELQTVIYSEVVKQVKNLYGLASESEHEFIHEFFEGLLPMFKLILVAPNDEGPGFVMVSFHIEVEAAVAIQWFSRIRTLDPNLRVTACYLRDSNGTSYVGDDAHVLRLYMVEQDLMSTFIQGNKDPEEIINKKVAEPKPSPLKTYLDYRVAINHFKKLVKQEGDIEH